jgi:hypothetical protein
MRPESMRAHAAACGVDSARVDLQRETNVRILLLVIAALSGLMMTLGCATEAGRVDHVATAGRDPVCVRQCTADHSRCAAGAGGTIGVGNMRSVLTACTSGYEACVGTCR